MTKAPAFHITIAAILSLGAAAAVSNGQTRSVPFELTFVNSPNGARILPIHVLEPDLRDGNGFRRVSKSTVFYSQERFRLQLQPKQGGYFYVLSRDSRGEVKLLYPLNEDGDNYIHCDTSLSLPNNGWFRFDENAGREELVLILSPLPLVTIDEAIQDGYPLGADNPSRYAAGTIIVRHIFLKHEDW